jgi:hypothetical protein
MSSSTYEAPGLAADWLNAWLAAVGVTVLVPGMRLSWSDDDPGRARFSLDRDADPLEAIVDAFPTQEWVDELPIALEHPDPACEATAPRNVPIEAYTERAALARRMQDRTLGACMTDLVGDISAGVPNARFNPAVPKGITLWQRLRTNRSAAVGISDDLSLTMAASLQGRATRIRGNGLGFDYRRITGASASGGSDPMVDPVIETLAFVGLTLFPARGVGDTRPRLRGWTSERGSPPTFVWPTWSEPLDCWAIDALLDLGEFGGSTRSRANLQRLGVRAVYGSVSYRPSGSSDATRGFASRRLW